MVKTTYGVMLAQTAVTRLDPVRIWVGRPWEYGVMAWKTYQSPKLKDKGSNPFIPIFLPNIYILEDI